jgi:hypothetical protein
MVRDIEFGGPATYRIVAQGAVDEDWRDRLAGMAISTARHEGLHPHTTLIGQIRDQAELNGVLETLYSLHLPILRVEQVEEDP